MMPFRHVRVFGSLVAGVLLMSSCSAASDITSFEPLVGAEPVAVALQSARTPVSGAPRLEISAVSAGIVAVWDVEGQACETGAATAARSRWIIEIRLHRGGDPLALCVASLVRHTYTTTVSGLVPGQYEVRFVDVYGGQLPTEIARRSLVVGK